MKFVTTGIFAGLLLVSGVAAAGVPSASTSSTAKPAQTMPCGRMQSPCPNAGQMGPGQRGMRNGMGPGMQNGAMGQGNRNNPNPPHKQRKARTATGSGVIYGSQLMTPQERAAYRQKLMNAKTAEERAKIRAEHHKEMQERAKKMGKTLPPAPPPSR
jgi:hypothetical protein